jgi:GntR family transcriptional regulator, transcriptional repressor for pyruvate dehydrogenase complex
LYEQIVQRVEESIQKGALKTGDELPPELAQQFGVSRTAVREAVKALREKGFVEAYPRRGTFIMETSSHPIRLSLDHMMKAGQAEGSRYLTEVR